MSLEAVSERAMPDTKLHSHNAIRRWPCRVKPCPSGGFHSVDRTCARVPAWLCRSPGDAVGCRPPEVDAMCQSGESVACFFGLACWLRQMRTIVLVTPASSAQQAGALHGCLAVKRPSAEVLPEGDAA